ncbi:MAG: hypothetical protein GY839_10940, partial [candidate division Zixibacteria bacterium]|nr:hypothetical protein [candidate division Zixibacteria bacterium]
MPKNILTIIISLTIITTCFAQDKPDSSGIDRLGQALESVGFDRGDLGYEPEGYWNRFPNPELIPHIMPFFEDLFAEPMKTYDFTKTMGNTVDLY